MFRSILRKQGYKTVLSAYDSTDHKSIRATANMRSNIIINIIYTECNPVCIIESIRGLLLYERPWRKEASYLPPATSTQRFRYRPYTQPDCVWLFVLNRYSDLPPQIQSVGNRHLSKLSIYVVLILHIYFALEQFEEYSTSWLNPQLWHFKLQEDKDYKMTKYDCVCPVDLLVLWWQVTTALRTRSIVLQWIVYNQ